MGRSGVAIRVRGQRAAVAAAAAAAGAFENERLTVSQSAAEAAVSPHTIRRAYLYGHLRVQRFGVAGRGIRIRRADLLRWLEAGGRTVPTDRKRFDR